ncbi:MAG: hypothetical protein EBW89_01445 [Candidatus Fonsibacter ubiquis]|nr:hypothetical protein [Candidatus Fonsibacter ubiquis]
MDGRTWDEYLYWFDETLKVKCPMVIFIGEDLISFVEERRKLIPTEIIVQKKSEIPYFYLKDKLDIIIESQEYKNKILGKNSFRVTIEAGVTTGWEKYTSNGISFGINSFGKSAPYKQIYKHFGLTSENITSEIRKNYK